MVHDKTIVDKGTMTCEESNTHKETLYDGGIEY